MREDLLAKVTSQIEDALLKRRAGEYIHAMAGIPNCEVTVCLGVGRCLYPTQAQNAETIRVCPFCMTLPSGAKPEQAAEIARRFVGGM